MLNTVSGLKVIFSETPVQWRDPHWPRFSETEQSRLQEEVVKMMEKGAIKVAAPRKDQFLGHLFLRPKKDGTFRPVLNLKKLNEFVRYEHFKMEGMSMVADLLVKDDWMIKIDLKDAYYCVPIAETHRKFFRFRWKGELYEYQVLPFGLASAPRTFTKLLKPVMGLLRRMGLQMAKTKALLKGGQSYETQVSMSEGAQEELRWWIESLSWVNGKRLIAPSPDLVMTTDASGKGWGAVCQGETTQGVWGKEETSKHINLLELRAARFAIMAFAKGQKDLHIHVKSDNSTTVAQINKMGGTRSIELLEETKKLWFFWLTKGITVTAEHLPGSQNFIADRFSRVFLDSSNWKLATKVFQELETRWGPFEVDMFADRLNRQKETYFSWKPDPLAAATDAFKVPWGNLKGRSVSDLFPPFCLIGRCLSKIKKEGARVVLIAPTWQAQPWFPHEL